MVHITDWTGRLLYKFITEVRMLAEKYCRDIYRNVKTEMEGTGALLRSIARKLS